MLYTNYNSKRGFALLPIALTIAGIAVVGLGVFGVYSVNKRGNEMKALSGEISGLKAQLSATASPVVSIAPTNEPKPTSTPTIAKPKVPNVKPVVVNTPTPMPVATQQTKKEKCEVEALQAKTKFVLQLENLKTKYQPEYEKIYYSLIAKGEYEKATLYQSQWQSQMDQINNAMTNAYDMALSGCLSK